MDSLNKIKVHYSHDQHILNLTLAAPKANVLDQKMMQELIGVVVQEGRKTAVKALVFRAEGRHFSFGASVQEHQKQFVAQMLTTFHALLQALIETAKPMLAIVQGQCLGGGLELVAFCHWIFAAEDAIFGQPEINLGVFPPVASLVLPYRIGQTAADDLILTGRSILAPEAAKLGLVSSVSPQPEKEVEKFIAQYILPRSAAALHWTVKASRHKMYRAFMRNIDAIEKMYVDELMATEDANEGIGAFLEKRKPVWQDK